MEYLIKTEIEYVKKNRNKWPYWNTTNYLFSKGIDAKQLRIHKFDFGIAKEMFGFENAAQAYGLEETAKYYGGFSNVFKIDGSDYEEKVLARYGGAKELIEKYGIDKMKNQINPHLIAKAYHGPKNMLRELGPEKIKQLILTHFIVEWYGLEFAAKQIGMQKIIKYYGGIDKIATKFGYPLTIQTFGKEAAQMALEKGLSINQITHNGGLKKRNK